MAKIGVTSNDNSKLSKAVTIGIITKRGVDGLRKNEQITQQEQRQFQLDCKVFLTRTSDKLLEKCPLRLPVACFLRSLDPQVMAGPISISVKLFERLLSILLDDKRVKETDVDFLKKEYASFIADECEEYDKVSALNVLPVFWLHTSKPVNTRSCGILSSAFLSCLMDRLVLNVAFA